MIRGSKVRDLRVHLRDERGDVPGWVLITIMSAGIVAILWPLAQDQLQRMLQSALDMVSP